MVVHISLFYLKNPADAPQMVTALRAVPAGEPSILSSFVGQNWASGPDLPGVPDFADVAQVVTFANKADAEAYADCAAHRVLRGATDDLIARVCAAEFEQ